MSERRDGRVWAVLAWLVFPALPVVLEGAYNGVLNFVDSKHGPPDPHEWNWLTWLTELGPLLGFGFLAGATIGLPEGPTARRGPRAWIARRGFWVAVGPWAAFVVWCAVVQGASFVRSFLSDDAFAWLPSLPEGWQNTEVGVVLIWLVFALGIATLGYSWLVFAVAGVRRARRLGTAWASVQRGLAVAAAFVGSLFASFWAVTEWWRSFFFDPRIVPVVLAAVTLPAFSGCASPISVGEARRRELFHAMLLAWVLGLALLWRWWARPRPPRT